MHLFSAVLGLLKIPNVPPHNNTLSAPPDPCHLSGGPHLTFLIPLIRVREVGTSSHRCQPSSGNQKTHSRFPFIQVWSHRPLPSIAGIIYFPSGPMHGLHYSSLNTPFGQILKGQC